jgi:hypothetical protein
VERVKSAFGEGGVNTKLLVVLAIGGVIALLRFVPLSFGGQPGAEDYAVLSGLWQKALQLDEKMAAAGEWSALESEALPVIDEIQERLAPIVESQGKEAPVAQRILWMVDVESGPTGANGYFRKILGGKEAAADADFTNGTTIMSEAAKFLP